jgi:curved DNA-binding protein
MSHYETLGIPKTSSPEEIKQAYRKAASKNHPDKGGDTVKFQQVEEAYRILSDPQKRSEYDNPLQQMEPNHFHFDFGGGNLHDIFSQFGFGPGSPFGRPPQPRRNSDVRTSINLGLRETLIDSLKTLSIKNATNERQNVDIRIPRGITSGTTIKYPGLGDSMFPNLPNGDLLVTVNVLQHPSYQAHGLDLTTNLTIDCFQAILGSEQTVVGLDGKTFLIKTPAGCQPNLKLKISGEGLWGFQNDIKGHLFVKVNVTIPTNLTEDQKNLIQAIANQR